MHASPQSSYLRGLCSVAADSHTCIHVLARPITLKHSLKPHNIIVPDQKCVGWLQLHAHIQPLFRKSTHIRPAEFQKVQYMVSLSQMCPTCA